MQVNAILTSKSIAGKKISTTISYLRQSQESKAIQLTTALNALTTNIYESTQVNEIGVTTKPNPSIIFGTRQTDAGNNYYWAITYSGDGQLFISTDKFAQLTTYSGQRVIMCPASTVSGTIYSTETNQYSAYSQDFVLGG